MMEGEPRVIRCWQCGKEMSVVRAQIGADVECPHCCSAVTVPAQLFGAPTARTIGTASSRPANKSPATAAVLNFFFWGAGYIYAGRDWGWAILIPSLILSLAAFTILVNMPEDAQVAPRAILTSIALSIFFAWHASYMVKKQFR
jgi:DNA-directed RNA polymerase subunit RPC12/RpoP